MFLDLHQGILEEFAAAQLFMTLRYEDNLEAKRARVLAARAAADRARREELRVQRRIRHRSWDVPAWSPKEKSPKERAEIHKVQKASWEKRTRERQDARIQKARARVVRREPPRPRVELRPCARCGEQAEYREGVKAPVGHRCSKK
jgi:hypothetical protein